jgi:purine-binding chemotaxis protein CheW
MTTPRDPRAILEARARQLARPVARTGEHFGMEALRFTLGRERYAIESRFVAGVFRLTKLVPLPGARSPVAGLTAWRGDVLTVLDIRRLLGRPAQALDDLAHVVVIGEGAGVFGILADVLEDTGSIDPSRLHPLSTEHSADTALVVRGLLTDGTHVLDAAAIIARQTEDARGEHNVEQTLQP